MTASTDAGAVLLTVALWSTCASACGVTASEIDALRSLLRNDPNVLAEHSIKQNDFRFLGIAEFSIAVPGLPDSCGLTENRVSIIPGTTDFLCGRDHASLVDRSKKFARIYNLRIRSDLERRGDLKCDF